MLDFIENLFGCLGSLLGCLGFGLIAFVLLGGGVVAIAQQCSG